MDVLTLVARCCGAGLLLLLIAFQGILTGGTFGCAPRRVFISGGSFIMGNDKTNFTDEKPSHKVTLSGFHISRFEVTINAFVKWANSEKVNYSFSGIAMDEKSITPCNPVRGISWFLANRFCRSAGGRLPTEAEWEYAAAVDTQNSFKKYPWPSGNRYPKTDEETDNEGGEDDDFGSFDPKSGITSNQSEIGEDSLLFERILPVQQSLKGINQLYGMMGNVWEWTDDWYAPYSASEQINPSGPVEGFEKTLRGGSYQNIFDPELMRSTLRNKAKPDAEYDHTGFRCVWPITP